jgi:hypothetical protein
MGVALLGWLLLLVPAIGWGHAALVKSSPARRGGREGGGTVDVPLDVRPRSRLAGGRLVGVGVALAGLAVTGARRPGTAASRGER